MSKGDTLERGLLELVLANVTTNVANIGDATGLRGSTTAGSLYVSLHTADPGEGGSQTTSEISYTGYARYTLARAAGSWTFATVVSGGSTAKPTANIDFGAMTGGTGGTVTHFGVGTALSGTGVLLYSGTVSPTISVTSGVTPRLTTATTISED